MIFAASPPSPVPTSAGMHLNSAIATALVVGIPSVLVAIFSYWLATRAKREQATASRVAIDADAYVRARELYESAIENLRQQVADLRTEVTRQREELTKLRWPH